MSSFSFDEPAMNLIEAVKADDNTTAEAILQEVYLGGGANPPPGVTPTPNGLPGLLELESEVKQLQSGLSGRYQVSFDSNIDMTTGKTGFGVSRVDVRTGAAEEVAKITFPGQILPPPP